MEVVVTTGVIKHAKLIEIVTTNKPSDGQKLTNKLLTKSLTNFL